MITSTVCVCCQSCRRTRENSIPRASYHDMSQLDHVFCSQWIWWYSSSNTPTEVAEICVKNTFYRWLWAGRFFLRFFKHFFHITSFMATHRDWSVGKKFETGPGPPGNSPQQNPTQKQSEHGTFFLKETHRFSDSTHQSVGGSGLRVKHFLG